MRVELAIDGTEVALGRNDALQHGASEGDVKYVSRRQVVLKAEGGLVCTSVGGNPIVVDPRPRFLLLSPAHTQELAADGTPVAPKAARRHRDDAEAERILTKSLASRGIAVVPVSSRTAAAFASGAIRHESRGNGSATRLYHFDDAGRLLILQLVAESLAGLAARRDSLA